MSSSVVEEQVDEVCASCGISGGDDVKLKLCTACKLVKYCSVECQKNHRPQHKKSCKKRAAVIREDLLFTPPPEGSYLGECPICCLPLSLDVKKWTINSCCCQRICLGCDWANKKREEEARQQNKCPFCREPLPSSVEEANQNYRRRAKAKDPVALCHLGNECHIVKGDYEGAFQYWTKAAASGDMDAQYQLSSLYTKGEGVETDAKKTAYHLEEAAIGGHPSARYNLGLEEGKKGRFDRAMKHFIIAANLGHVNSLDRLKEGHMAEVLSKEDYASALRGHQAAVDAVKSAQRDEAEKARREGLYCSNK